MVDQGHGDLTWWLLNVAVLSRVVPLLMIWLVCSFLH